MVIFKRLPQVEFQVDAMGTEQVQDDQFEAVLPMVKKLSECASQPICTLAVRV
jgi:hypothetical protein